MKSDVVPSLQQEPVTSRTVNKHLLQLADGAYAKAERSRRKWHMARLTSTPEVAASIRRRMLKHQAIAYYLDAVCRGRYEPG
jgi:hypothetical protein